MSSHDVRKVATAHGFLSMCAEALPAALPILNDELAAAIAAGSSPDDHQAALALVLAALENLKAAADMVK